MLISTKHRFVFIHIPKTGGSSITAALAPFLDDPKEPDPEQRKGWQIKHHAGKMHATLAESEVPKDFLIAFVRRGMEGWRESLEHHWPGGDPWGRTPDHWWSGYVLSSHPVRILRFEHLDEDFAKFCVLVGLPPLDLPHLNEHPR